MIPRDALIKLCLLLLFIYGIYLWYDTPSREELLFADELTTDSTYSDFTDSMIFNEMIRTRENLELPALNDWSEIIRLRGEDGWGSFDYICSVYNGDQPAIQLIQQHPYNMDGSEIGYNIKERFLSQTEYDSIWQRVMDLGIHKMPFDLEPDLYWTHGTHYIALKSGAFRKSVYWQDMRYLETEEKRKAINFYYDLLCFAGYPMPQVVIHFNKMDRDSAYYHFKLNDYQLVDSCIFGYQEKIRKDYGMEIAVPLADTNLVEARIRASAILYNGDTVEINKYRLQDLRGRKIWNLE